MNYKQVLILAGMISVASVASASPVTYTYTGETGGGVTIGLSTATYTGNVQVGEFIMTSTTPGYQSPLLTYCTDVGAVLATTYNYTPTALSSASGVTPAWVSGGIQHAATLWFNDHGSATTAVQTAGLQLAIWELLYNGATSGYSASSFTSAGNGGFKVTSSDANTVSAINYAVSVLNAFSTLATANNVEWLAPTAANGSITGSQGLLVQLAGTTTPPPNTPDATSTLGLMGMVVAAMGAMSRKLGNKHSK